MYIKILSVNTSGRIRKTINQPSTEQRIIELHKALGLTPKQAYRELQWLNVRTQTNFNQQ